MHMVFLNTVEIPRDNQVKNLGVFLSIVNLHHMGIKKKHHVSLNTQHEIVAFTAFYKKSVFY